MRNERAISKFQMRQRLQSTNSGKRISRVAWFSIANLSHVSQVGIFILACFGYFYTVLPVYTKALLEESIAKYEMELPALKENNLALKNELRISNEKLIEIKKLVGQEKEELDKLHKELFEQYKTHRSNALSGIKFSMETQCYFFLVNANFTGVVDAKLIDSVTSCLRNSPEQSTHFLALSTGDKSEIRNQTRTLSAKFAKTGARVLAEQVSQEGNMKAVSAEQKIAEIERQSERIKVLLTEVSKGISSISLSDVSHKKAVRE